MTNFYYTPRQVSVPRRPDYKRIGGVGLGLLIVFLCSCVTLANLIPGRINDVQPTPTRTPTTLPTATPSPSPAPPTPVPTFTPFIPPSPTVVSRSEGSGTGQRSVSPRPTSVPVRPRTIPTVRVYARPVSPNSRQSQLAVPPLPPALPPPPTSDPDDVSGLEKALYFFGKSVADGIRSMADGNFYGNQDMCGYKPPGTPSRNKKDCP